LPQTGQGPPTYLAQSSSTMTGIGATPEALEVNPVTWDLLWEMGWRSTAPDMSTWVADYVGRRYGLRADRPTPLLQQAWQVLLSSQYTASVGNYATSQLCWLEQEPQVSYAHIAADRVGQPDGIAEAFRLMLASVDAAEVNISQPSFLYDLVDLGRQLCCNVHSDLAILAGWEFLQLAGHRSPCSLMGANSSVAAVNATHTALVQLIRDLDELLSTHPSFLIGPRIDETTAWAKGNVSAQAALQYQFLNQITIWGPTRKLSVSSGHNDYAAKNGWAGLVGEYYGGRWAIHAAGVAAAVASGTAPHVDTTAALEQFEEAWSRHGAGSGAPFLTTTQGDTIAVARKLLRTYAPGAANTSHYAVFKLMDAVPASDGAGVDMIQAWNTDVGVLTAICASRVAST
jgi:alpha-N-acetylglucosaminidase